MRSRLKTGMRIAGAVVVLVLLGILILVWRGDRGAIGPDGPASLRTICLAQEPRSDRVLLERCFRVRGTLLHVWRDRDPSGQVGDMHLLVVARLRLYVVKVYPPYPADLLVGHEVIVVGPLVRPHPEHLGIHEIEGFSLSGGGIRR
jgi:hypothetical protein